LYFCLLVALYKTDLKSSALLLFSILLPACSGESNDAAWWDNEKQIIELRSQIDLARYRVKTLDIEAPELTDSPSSSQLITEIGALTNEKSRLADQIAEMRNGWEDFRAGVLAQRRAQVMGKTFDTFETPEGRAYHEVTISMIDDGGVSFRHKVGMARLRFDDLDQGGREFFGLDGDLAAIAHEAEATRRAEYNIWIEQGLAVAKAEEAKLAKIRREEEDRLASARAIAARNRSSTPSALTASFGGLGDTRTIYSSGRYSSSRYYRRPRTRYYYTYNTQPSCPPEWTSNTSVYRPSIAVQGAPAAQCTTNPFAP